MKKSTCPKCDKEIEVSEDGKFVVHRRFLPRSEQDYEENVHCRNIVHKECLGSKTFESYLSFLKYLNQKMSEGNTSEVENLLRESFLEWEILEITSINQIQGNSQLTPEEKDYYTSELESGKAKVWVIVDIVPWEH